MLRFHSIHRLDQIEQSLRSAAERHGGSVLAVTRVSPEALTFSMCLSHLHGPLLAADARFAAFLPPRVAACAHGNAVTLETIAPREFCRMLHRPELESLAGPLEDELKLIMEEASRPMVRTAGANEVFPSTEDQVNMRASIPQRLDCRGTKVEELAGTGTHDAQGG
jgi:uncharacterized protein (DUF302 family)